MRAGRTSLSCTLLLALTLLGASARAQTIPDAPGFSPVVAGHGKVRLTVTAGPSGAPAGFEVCWMTAEQFAALDGIWPQAWVRGQGWVDFTGTATLNTWGSAEVPFALGPNQAIDIEIGDTRGESGVSGMTGIELAGATDYVFVVIALGPEGSPPSPLSLTLSSTTTPQGEDCTYTIGWWKNHAEAWPVASLQLGSVSYTAPELLSILGQAVAGNGLVSLAHQLIAAKLNVQNGADPAAVASAIAAADALIGSLVVPPVGTGTLAPAATNALTQDLDDFNNGLLGPGHCGSTPARVSTWGRLKTIAR